MGTQVHLLLFMVALFHIVTAAVVLVIANLRMRSWWRWKQCDDQEARLCASSPCALRALPDAVILTWRQTVVCLCVPVSEGQAWLFTKWHPAVISAAASQAIRAADSRSDMRH